MIYECETCEATLSPGLAVCPRCGRVFDEPVPDDARREEPDPIAILEQAPEPPVLVETVALVEAVAPEAVTGSRRKTRARGLPPSIVSLLILGLCWFGSRYWKPPPAPQPVPPARPVLAAAVRPPTDLAAHPHYAANMTTLVQKLRATGVGAEWPAFGSDDALLITPQARAAEPPVVWDADMNRRLAQGIYGEFAQTRFESGFSDGDTTACFVLVTDVSGQVVAVDFMGSLE